jgi:hypothetical protein
LRIDDSVTKESGDGCIHSVTTLGHNISNII